MRAIGSKRLGPGWPSRFCLARPRRHAPRLLPIAHRRCARPSAGRGESRIRHASRSRRR
ncbi:hypothetical protein BURPS1655_F0088 [Burkholderia pseudomallei 1655]|nr:hypothetical protein BURPS1655_F0088 [Burkholderia pseudomallei 1655]